MPAFQDAIEQQFKELIKNGRDYIRQAREAELSLPPSLTSEVASWVTKCGQMITTFSTRKSEYYEQYARSLRVKGFYQISRKNYRHLCLIEGTVNALYDDYRKGLLKNLTGALQTEIFADFLVMAQDWLEAGRKDSAAVLIGSVLESTLNKLAGVMSVPTQTGAVGKTFEQLNDELFAQGIYDKLTHSQLRTFATVRDQAVDGQFDKIHADQVRMMLMFTQGFCQSQLS